MTILLYALAGVALLIASVVIVGLMMPERYEGRTRVELARSVDDVWEALLDYNRHPMTGRMKRGVEQGPDLDGLPTWVEDMGRGEQVTVRTREADAPRRMVREMESGTVPMSSRWTYELEEHGDGCAVTLHGETYIRRGTWHVPIFRILMVLGGGVRSGLDIQLGMVAETLGVEPRRS
jgi:hypothetical protein